MDTFFSIIKRGIVATMLVLFSFMALYVPSPVNQVKQAQAVDLVFDVDALIQSVLNFGELQEININSALDQAWNKLSSVYNSITSYATNSLFTKEYILDGIAWSIAKSVVSSMVGDLLNWINSGFHGSPAFVQDLIGHLVDAADREVGYFLDEIGGAGSFLCSPFKLDIQVALATKYQRDRVDQLAPTCNLSDIVSNIEDFMSGAQGSFSEGGWEDWLTISRSAEVYTPYGSLLAAESSMRAQILNAEFEAKAYLDFGDGFLSGEICELVHGEGTTQEDCFISKPGKIIQEALSFNLDSGRESLITADEIDEIIGSLLQQLANTAISGAAGLLGLTGGTGETYSGFDSGSYVGNLGSQSVPSSGSATILSTMSDALTTQKSLNIMATDYKTKLSNKLSTLSDPTSTQAVLLQTTLTEIQIVIDETNTNITNLTNLITEVNSPATTDERRDEIAIEFSNLPLYDNSQVTFLKSEWQKYL